MPWLSVADINHRSKPITHCPAMKIWRKKRLTSHAKAGDEMARGFQSPRDGPAARHAVLRFKSPFAFKRAITIGPSENSPRSARLVRSRR